MLVVMVAAGCAPVAQSGSLMRRWEELRCRRHIAEFGGVQIVVVVCDRDLTSAQESGMHTDRLLSKHVRIQPPATCRHWLPRRATATTEMVPYHYTRQQPMELLHTKLIDRPRGDQASGLRLTFIADYHHTQARHGIVTLTRGAWSSGAHNGAGFVHWAGSAAQRAALQRADHVSRTVHAARSSEREPLQLEGAIWRVLRDELQPLLGRSVGAPLPPHPAAPRAGSRPARLPIVPPDGEGEQHMSPKPAKPTSRARTPAKPSQPSHDAIADRAYQISQTEPTGDPVSDWQKAEQELTPQPRPRRTRAQ